MEEKKERQNATAKVSVRFSAGETNPKAMKQVLATICANRPQALFWANLAERYGIFT
jgi:hypothetical protein